MLQIFIVQRDVTFNTEASASYATELGKTITNGGAGCEPNWKNSTHVPIHGGKIQVSETTYRQFKIATSKSTILDNSKSAMVGVKVSCILHHFQIVDFEFS